MSLSFLGFLSIICSLLVTINKDKYKWLLAGFKNKPKIAIAYYSIVGAALMICGFVNISYLNDFILPAFVLFLSLLTILAINSKKSNKTS